MVKQIIILLVLYFFGHSNRQSWWARAGACLSRSQLEPGVFGPLEPEPEPLEKKPGAGAAWKKSGAGAKAAWEKSQEPEPLEKKSGARAGAAKKFAGSPALVLGIGSIHQK